MQKMRGFTMIEFLIVMVLIGILAVLGGGAYTKSLKKGRDAKRVADMQEIQKGFEMYYTTNTTTPGAYSGTCTNMMTIPTPPAGGAGYVGTCSPTAYNYCAPLELPTVFGNATTVAGVPVPTEKPLATLYCVFNVQ